MRLAHHAGTADKNILDRVIEDVPDGEASGYIGWRNEYGKGFLPGIYLGAKVVPLEPMLIPSALHLRRIVHLGEFTGVSQCSARGEFGIIKSWIRCSIFQGSD